VISPSQEYIQNIFVIFFLLLKLLLTALGEAMFRGHDKFQDQEEYRLRSPEEKDHQQLLETGGTSQ
jgi:hypothetical protein